jgi:predicted CoA-binding protein
MKELTTDSEIAQVLKTARNVVIVGISNKPDRPSNEVAHWLRDNTSYKLFYVNPAIDEVFGEKVYPNLQAVQQHLNETGERIDIVDVFRKVSDMEPVFRDAVEIGARVFWQQLGLRGGLPDDLNGDVNLISDKCIKIEYHRLIPA